MAELKRRTRGRPPKVQADNLETRETIIQVGMRLFSCDGFMLTSLDRILTEGQVTKGSFYNYFASKDALGKIVLERYARAYSERLSRFLMLPDISPIMRLKTFIMDDLDHMIACHYQSGCLVNKLSQEYYFLSDDMKELVESTLTSWQQQTALCVREAIDIGEVSPTIDPERLSSLIWTSYHGALQRARNNKDVTPVHIFVEDFLSMVTS